MKQIIGGTRINFPEEVASIISQIPDDPLPKNFL